MRKCFSIPSFPNCSCHNSRSSHSPWTVCIPWVSQYSELPNTVLGIKETGCILNYVNPQKRLSNHKASKCRGKCSSVKHDNKKRSFLFLRRSFWYYLTVATWYPGCYFLCIWELKRKTQSSFLEAWLEFETFWTFTATHLVERCSLLVFQLTRPQLITHKLY